MTEPLAILEAKALCKRYGGNTILDGVTFTVERGAMLSIVGESGSGKSTLLRCLAFLQQPDSGEVCFEGSPLRTLRGMALTAFRQQVQLVMQDAAMGLNPHRDALSNVQEPLDILRRELERATRQRLALASMADVGLDTTLATRYPLELSGGQRQRLQIARAMVLRPRMLLLDEPFAGLDAPVQAELVALLEGLRRNQGLTCVLVTHDLELAWSVSSRIAVLSNGRLGSELVIRDQRAIPDFRKYAGRHSGLAGLVMEFGQNEGIPAEPISNQESDAP